MRSAAFVNYTPEVMQYAYRIATAAGNPSGHRKKVAGAGRLILLPSEPGNSLKAPP